MHFFSIVSVAAALAGTAFAVPAGKPTGGPASATVTIYSGPASCPDPNTVSLCHDAPRTSYHKCWQCYSLHQPTAPLVLQRPWPSLKMLAQLSILYVNISSSHPCLCTQLLTNCALQPFGGALTSKMTAVPKTGTTACYIQIFSQSGCGLTLQNQFHGFPFNGLTIGSEVGCAQPPVQSYGALQIVCGWDSRRRHFKVISVSAF
jgi:hypothetical protein